jgi:hypothetical protein
MTNILNIDNLTGPNTSMVKVLLIFYLLITTNFTDNLVSKQLKTFFEDNRLGQHVIAIIALLVLITSVGGVVDNRKAIVYTLVGYTWFIFTTKLDIHWNMIIIMILMAGYLIENNLTSKEKLMEDDKALTEDDKKRVIKKSNKVKNIVIVSALSVTIIGTLLYSNKKHIQYGGGYDPVKFLLY